MPKRTKDIEVEEVISKKTKVATPPKAQQTHHKRHANRSALPPRRASLLGLLAELRNKIYDNVMEDVMDRMSQDDSERLTVRLGRHKQSAICRASRQLRNETLSLFYSEFYFYVKIRDLEFAPQRHHFVWKQDPIMWLRGTESWNNLKEWLHLYWEDRSIPAIIKGPEYSKYDLLLNERLCSYACKIVGKLADEGVKWEAVEYVLEAYKMASEASEGGEDTETYLDE